MAHPICGIDVGAYSIKLVVFEVGFRQAVYRGTFEQVVGDGAGSLLSRQVQAVREALSRVSSEAIPYLAMPGDLLSIRTLELPFSDARKIDQVVGYELEGQIVHALDDVVFDHIVIRSTDEGANVLAVAAKRDDISTWLDAFRGAGIDPRALYAAPVAYRSLGIDGPGALDDPMAPAPAILDLGHARTNLFIGRDAQGVLARAITRGGSHLTAAIADALELDRERAEQIKRGEARLLPAGKAMAGGSAARLDQILRTALAPLVRDVRQSFASFRATSHREVGALYVCGGTGRLAGLLPFIEEELGVPTVFLSVHNSLQGRTDAEMGPDVTDFGAGSLGEREDTAVDDVPVGVARAAIAGAPESSSFALAMGIGRAAARQGREIDLRRGPFVYSASFSVLRQKAAHLVLLAAAIIVGAGLDAFASLSNLGSDRKLLDTQLKAATQEVFGQSRSDAKVVAQVLRKGFKEELAPVPKATAFDLLEQISQKVPAAESIKLDIAEIDIRSKKTFIKGTVDSATAVDQIAEKLKEIDCYEDVTKGAVTEVANEAKQFTLNVSSKCP